MTPGKTLTIRVHLPHAVAMRRALSSWGTLEVEAAPVLALLDDDHREYLATRGQSDAYAIAVEGTTPQEVADAVRRHLAQHLTDRAEGERADAKALAELPTEADIVSDPLRALVALPSSSSRARVAEAVSVLRRLALRASAEIVAAAIDQGDARVLVDSGYVVTCVADGQIADRGARVEWSRSEHPVIAAACRRRHEMIAAVKARAEAEAANRYRRLVSRVLPGDALGAERDEAGVLPGDELDRAVQTAIADIVVGLADVGEIERARGIADAADLGDAANAVNVDATQTAPQFAACARAREVAPLVVERVTALGVDIVDVVIGIAEWHRPARDGEEADRDGDAKTRAPTIQVCARFGSRRVFVSRPLTIR